MHDDGNGCLPISLVMQGWHVPLQAALKASLTMGGAGAQLGGGLSPGLTAGGGFGGMPGRPPAAPIPGGLQRPGSSLAGSGPGMQQVL